MFKIEGCWLTPGEQDEVIARLWQAGLLKCDNGHKLPLKSGGTTDIYVNLRMMRSDPVIMDYLARIYAQPLHQLRLDRFAEVPEALSPMAGILASQSGQPFVTIREEAKQGRVSGGRIIGELEPCDRVAIIDDVITDGESKIPALVALREAGAQVAAIVVLVDRQQGWDQKLDKLEHLTNSDPTMPTLERYRLERGIIPVWPAMTLHDIRKYLIEHGLMQRCDPQVEESNPIIIALDGRSWDESLPLLDKLRTSGCIWKVNDMMLDRGLSWIVPNLSVYGRVMVDLKGHDIPNTVRNICRHIAPLHPWAVTVHASGGEAMMRAAVETLAGTGTKVLAVTVLTSLDNVDCKDIYNRASMDQIMYFAKMANVAGADGIVCSPNEVSVLSSMSWNRKKLFVTPGVRSAGVAAGDQKRVETPKAAMKAGATHLVIGRQILEADDPAAEVAKIRQEIV